jgi:NifU-like protein involved in Fe-S cluster formation
MHMVKLDELYSQRVLELSANIPRTGRLEDPHGIASVYSKLCGSRITVTLKMEGDTVTDYAQDVRACLLGQTSAAVMGANIVGTTTAELREVREQMLCMLREGGPPPEGRWADLAILESVRYYKARHGSTMLVFEAVEEAISAIENEREEFPPSP